MNQENEREFDLRMSEYAEILKKGIQRTCEHTNFTIFGKLKVCSDCDKFL